MAFLVGGFYFFREKKDLLLSFPLFQKAYADYLLEEVLIIYIIILNLNLKLSKVIFDSRDARNYL